MTSPDVVPQSAREKAYLSWINAKLTNVCPQMQLRALDDTRMKNGAALGELVGAFSGKSLMLKFPCTTREGCILNLKEILRRLKQLRVPIQNICESDIADGNKVAIMRLLLSMSASFMPTHIHDVKHELQERPLMVNAMKNRMQQPVVSWDMRHQPQPTQRLVSIPQYRLQPIPIMHGICSAGILPHHLTHTSLHWRPVRNNTTTNNKTNNSQILPHHQQNHLMIRRSPSLNTFVRDRARNASEIFEHPCAPPTIGVRAKRSLENLLESSSPLRAANSLSALQDDQRVCVSKLMIPQLDLKQYTKSNGNPHRIFSNVAAPSSQFQPEETVNRSRNSSMTSDGYVNHGFTDSPHLHGRNALAPKKELTAMRVELGTIKNELLRLQELLSLEAPEQASVGCGSTSDFASSLQRSDDQKSPVYIESQTSELQGIKKVLKTRTEAMDACLTENYELRQTIQELSSALKSLQITGNCDLRHQQYLQTNEISINPSYSIQSRGSGLRNWSFSSESVPCTPQTPVTSPTSKQIL